VLGRFLPATLARLFTSSYLLKQRRASCAKPYNESIVACGSDVIPTKRSFHNENLKLLETELLALSLPGTQSCLKFDKRALPGLLGAAALRGPAKSRALLVNRDYNWHNAPHKGCSSQYLP